jgi:hypothetical protein
MEFSYSDKSLIKTTDDAAVISKRPYLLITFYPSDNNKITLIRKYRTHDKFVDWTIVDKPILKSYCAILDSLENIVDQLLDMTSNQTRILETSYFLRCRSFGYIILQGKDLYIQ